MKYVLTYTGIIVLLLLTGCLKDKPLKLQYEGYTPVQRNDGWEYSTLEAESMQKDMVDKAYRLVYADDRFMMARSLLIIRNGKLVAEAYPHDKTDIDRIANIQSMTKSFTSIVAGIALRKGLIDSVNEPLNSIYPERFVHNPEKSGITLKNALTMTTGINFDNDVDTKTMYETRGNSVEFVLSKPKVYEPGEVFHYHDGAPQLVSAAVQKRAGQTFSEFAGQNLFQPLGITEWQWEAAKDGNTFGAFSLFIKPRDAARFGKMLVQNGMWSGQQVVDSSWIAQVSHPWVNSNSLGTPYGYYFWIYPTYGAYAADGHGGQRIMIFPDKNLVIVYTAWGYTNSDLWDSFNEIADLISKSCN